MGPHGRAQRRSTNARGRLGSRPQRMKETTGGDLRIQQSCGTPEPSSRLYVTEMIGGWAIRPTLKRGNLQAISVGLRCERSASCKVVAVSAQRRHALVRFLCCNGHVNSGTLTFLQVYSL